MIKLRPLILEDSKEMLLFTTDLESKLNTNFLNYSNTINDFEFFIEMSRKNKKNLHYAIDYDGKYAGTVSLKNINTKKKSAEFAIIVHPNFRGKGVGKTATKLILNKAKKENIHTIFLNVFEDNLKAISLYKKIGFKKYFTTSRNNLFEKKIKKLIWMKKYI